MVSGLRQAMERAGRRAGLERLGVASLEEFSDVRKTMEERLESGYSARLTFTYKDPRKATTPALSFPWATAMVVGLRSYLPDAGPSEPRPGHARVARFAVADPYPPLRRGLAAVGDVLASAGHRVEALADDDRLVDRAAAVRAGIGWWGKSTLVLTPGLGPWFVIGAVMTDAALDPDEPMVRSCGSCSACLPACPTGALVAPGVLDARRCLAAIAQGPGVIPREWRWVMGDRLYGCDDCLDACPPGQRAAAAPGPDGSVPLAQILTAGDDELMDRFGHFYLPRRTPRILRRNALVAAGNQPGAGLDSLVVAYLGHSDWLLRVHAVWALAQLGGPQAERALARQRSYERHPEVVAELELAV